MLRAFFTCFALVILLAPGPGQAREPRARSDREGPAQRDERQDFRGLREQLREGRDGPPLRRLGPDEREQLRRDVRDAGREHYRR